MPAKGRCRSTSSRGVTIFLFANSLFRKNTNFFQQKTCFFCRKTHLSRLGLLSSRRGPLFFQIILCMCKNPPFLKFKYQNITYLAKFTALIIFCLSYIGETWVSISCTVSSLNAWEIFRNLQKAIPK